MEKSNDRTGSSALRLSDITIQRVQALHTCLADFHVDYELKPALVCIYDP